VLEPSEVHCGSPSTAALARRSSVSGAVSCWCPCCARRLGDGAKMGDHGKKRRQRDSGWVTMIVQKADQLIVQKEES